MSHRNVVARVCGSIAIVALSAWIASGQQSKKVDTTALRNAAKNGDEWLTQGHDYTETYFSPLKQIDSKNVKRLGLAWTWETEAPTGSNVEAPMLVSNGVMYGILGWDVMFAVDARTGQLKWRWDPEIPRSVMAGICCTPSNRGVATYNGRIYAGMLDGTLVALDQETGKPVWRTKVTEKADTLLTSPVRIVKGKVIVGSSGADNASRGFFAAYDADTANKCGASTRCPAILPKVSNIRNWKWRRRPGPANGGKRVAAAPFGTAWPMMRPPTYFTSAPATAARGTQPSAALKAATTCS
jgi:glucose dehydrogenase